MTEEPLGAAFPEADAPAAVAPGPVPDLSGFASALSEAGAALRSAGNAEAAFAGGRGGLAEMMVSRARADVTLAVASAAASRLTQALSTVLGMQI
jgi:hypothetical protein